MSLANKNTDELYSQRAKSLCEKDREIVDAIQRQIAQAEDADEEVPRAVH